MTLPQYPLPKRPIAKLRNRLSTVVLCIFMVVTTGCESLGYYYQSATGHLSLLARQRSFEQVRNSPQTPRSLIRQLEQVERIVAFAEQRLALPANGSYEHFTDTKRDAVVWSVVATPTYSLTPKQWCYAVIGCAAYRGYFDEEAANNYATELAASGMDVAVQPVPAYSTLGWFADPVPSTVVGWPPGELAELLFHELAHQRVYVRDDSNFNEAYASVVAKAGVTAWFDETGATEQLAKWYADKQQQLDIETLYRNAHAQLTKLYGKGIPDAEKEAAKARIFAALQAAVAQVRGRQVASVVKLNNAHLASLATYRSLAPAFRELFREARGGFAKFHQLVERLSQLPANERKARLKALIARNRGAERRQSSSPSLCPEALGNYRFHCSGLNAQLCQPVCLANIGFTH